MSHECKAVLFKCMDFRLLKSDYDWMEKELLIGDCDVVSLAGAGKSFIDGSPEVVDFLFEQVRIAHDVHHVCQVVLLHHSDCGAYRLKYSFADQEEEKQKQLADMEKAKNIIQIKFPDVKVVKIWEQMPDKEGEKAKYQKIE